MLTTLIIATLITVAGESVPPRQPQLAGLGKLVALTFGAQNRIYFAASSDGGAHFSAPRLVASVDFTPLGRHRGPRVALTQKTVLISAIVGKQSGRDGDLAVWRSEDGGESWSPPRLLNSVSGSAREGLHGMAASPDGVVLVVWLDDRSGRKQLFGAISRDHGRSWSKDRLIYASPDGHVCECCHPSAAIGPQGELIAMWRNWLQGARDMYMAHSADGGESWAVRKLGTGTWLLQACPMDGGGLSISEGKLVSAWRRQNGIFLTLGDEPEQQIGQGRNPAPAGQAVVWEDAAGRIALKRNLASSIEIVAPRGAFPTMTTSSLGLVLAWESPDRIEVTVKK